MEDGRVAFFAAQLVNCEASATLVQFYTGLVYAGPSLVKQINRALLTRDM